MVNHTVTRLGRPWRQKFRHGFSQAQAHEGSGIQRGYGHHRWAATVAVTTPSMSLKTVRVMIS